MPKAASSNSNQGPSFQPPRHRPHWVTASVCGVLAILITVAFADYKPDQVPRFVTTNPTDHNAVGLFGAYTTFWSYWWFGVGAWLIPAFLYWMAYVALRNVRQLATARWIAMFFCLLSGAGLAAMIGGFTGNWFPNDLGGQLGKWIYNGFLSDLMGGFGSAVVLGLVYVLSIVFICTSDIGAEFDRAFQWFQDWRAQRKELRAE